MIGQSTGPVALTLLVVCCTHNLRVALNVEVQLSLLVVLVHHIMRLAISTVSVFIVGAFRQMSKYYLRCTLKTAIWSTCNMYCDTKVALVSSKGELVIRL